MSGDAWLQIQIPEKHDATAIQALISWPERCGGDWARGFVAGIFDAEGSFAEGVMRIANSDQRMIDATTASLTSLGFDTVAETQARRARPLHHVRVRGGLRAHLRLIRSVDPSIGRKRDISEQAVKSKADLRIVAIERMTAKRDLFDITTGTGNFIANGVISHNCYARPSHAYLGLSPGLDFETRIFAKTNAAELLRKELSAPGYRCSVISLGANTDPYQPAERELCITRSILEVLAEFQHPFTIVTKNAMVERDLDLIAPMAARNLARVFLSVTNLDPELARKLEPRASAPHRRLAAIRRVASAGVPCGVLVAPIIPFLNDGDLEAILEAAKESGATWAGYIVLRLPHELKGLFKDWLTEHYPLRADRIMARIRDLRGGRENDPRFGARMEGTGDYAELIRRRFEQACRRVGLESGGRTELDITAFRVPGRHGQLSLL